MGDLVGRLVQLVIGQRLPFEMQGDGVGRALHLLFKLFVDAALGKIRGGGVPPGCDAFQLCGWQGRPMLDPGGDQVQHCGGHPVWISKKRVLRQGQHRAGDQAGLVRQTCLRHRQSFVARQSGRQINGIGAEHTGLVQRGGKIGAGSDGHPSRKLRVIGASRKCQINRHPVIHLDHDLRERDGIGPSQRAGMPPLPQRGNNGRGKTIQQTAPLPFRFDRRCGHIGCEPLQNRPGGNHAGIKTRPIRQAQLGQGQRF